MNERRSAIPKAIGILMIIFASLVLLRHLWAIAIYVKGVGAFRAQVQTQAMKWEVIQLFEVIVGLGINVLHLFAGIAAVQYKADAPRLAVAYGVINIVIQVALLIFLFYEAQEPTAAATIILLRDRAIVVMVWSMIVLVLMTRPRARSACTS